jgi:hypothetical protein
VITPDQVAREKKHLPRGWGRFGKAIDRLAEVSEPDEMLLSTCVALNPSFHHTTVVVEGFLVELFKSTNVILGATNKRLIVVSTGLGGAPRDHYAIAYAGLEIPSHSKKGLTLRWPEGEVEFRGAAKQQLPGFLDALTGQLQAP